MFKGKGGGQRPFEQCSKELHFSYGTASLRADFVSIKVDCGMMTGIVRSMMMRRKRSDTWKVLVHSYITPEEFTICDLKSF